MSIITREKTPTALMFLVHDMLSFLIKAGGRRRIKNLNETCREMATVEPVMLNQLQYELFQAKLQIGALSWFEGSRHARGI